MTGLSSEFFSRRGILTHNAPSDVLARARRIITRLEAGTPYWRLHGKRLHWNRSVISIPGGPLVAQPGQGSRQPGGGQGGAVALQLQPSSLYGLVFHLEESMFKKLFKPVAIPFFRKSEKGQGSAEFGTILAALIVVVLIVMAIFRDSLISLFQRIASLMGGG
ncbi:MAG: hypothetical protein ABSA51_13775 [Anaerolineaceae bacterium]|jgi:Flp pilus assembly pilin Flp